MAMQTDVQSARLSNSGLALSGRTRLKGFIANGTSTAGGVTIWDSLVAPTTATYAQSGTTVTVTKSSHGLTTGQAIGISYAIASGLSGTNGNYTVTVVDSSTFTITDPNSNTVVGGTACSYITDTVGSNDSTDWVMTVDTYATTGGAQVVQYLLPGEGILIHSGMYCSLTNMTSITVFYG